MEEVYDRVIEELGAAGVTVPGRMWRHPASARLLFLWIVLTQYNHKWIVLTIKWSVEPTNLGLVLTIFLDYYYMGDLLLFFQHYSIQSIPLSELL